jgi:hypothetical protein
MKDHGIDNTIIFCALCKDEEATKTNTHYLSDGIIRRALNEDGSNVRAKSLNFDLSPSTKDIEFKFGQKTSRSKLDEIYGREVTSEEIKKAMKIEFSVDCVFCPRCEKIFTSIEDRFYKEILPKLRNADLSDTDHITLADNELVRLFFYMQYWRTHVATGKMPLSSEIAEMMRLSVLNQSDMDSDLFYELPIHIAFLETLGDDMEYTKNPVGHNGSRSPYILMMNDFLIRLYEKNVASSYDSYHGLYNKETYQQMVNIDRGDFKIEIISDTTRKEFAKNYAGEEVGMNKAAQWASGFHRVYSEVYQEAPSHEQIHKLIQHIVFSGDEPLELRYKPDTIEAKTIDFIQLISEGKV